MYTTLVLTALAGLAAQAQAQYGAASSSMNTIQTTSTNYVTKTVFAATHTSTVTMTSSVNGTAAASFGLAHATGAANASSSPIVPIISSSAEAVKIGAGTGAARAALVGAIMVGALFM